MSLSKFKLEKYLTIKNIELEEIIDESKYYGSNYITYRFYEKTEYLFSVIYNQNYWDTDIKIILKYDSFSGKKIKMYKTYKMLRFININLKIIDIIYCFNYLNVYNLFRNIYDNNQLYIWNYFKNKYILN